MDEVADAPGSQPERYQRRDEVGNGQPAAGGLANVNYNSADNRNDRLAGRPLVVSKRVPG